MLKTPELFASGYHIVNFVLPEEVRTFVRSEKWQELDDRFKDLCQKNGELFKFLRTFHDFSSIEFIISIRDAKNEWEEDGIWHDDGSRVFAFSLSLTEDPGHIKGGRLGIRRFGESSMREIPTPEFGEMILFLTGTHGFEHRIHQVLEGRRVIIAGWCS